MQDIVSALGWVRMMISDVQNVLLEFDDSDLEELAQVRSDLSLRQRSGILQTRGSSALGR